MKKFNLLLIIFIPAFIISCKSGKKDVDSLKEIPEQKPIEVSGMIRETVEFPSGDGLAVTAYVYQIDTISPVIVMCHQARMNHYEYAEIAPKMAKKGYNCVVLDLRSGGSIGENQNLTYNRAMEKNLPTEYLDAEQDIVAGINYAYSRWNQPVILWGSSYSAGLSLKIGKENDKVSHVIAFSPGEYYGNKLSVKESLHGFSKTSFVTSTEKEAAEIEKMLSDVPDGIITQYFPDTKGTHGSKSLWESDPSNEMYWNALNDWLGKM